MNKDFFDTNVLIYAFGADRRTAVAQRLLSAGGWISVQSLNEFTNVAINKLGMNWTEIHDALHQIQILCGVGASIDVELHQAAIGIAEHYRLKIFDALILAAALRADCETLWSEDMHDGLVVDGRLTIRNPFDS